VTCLAKLEYEIPMIKGWELICTFDIVPMSDNEMEVFTSKVPGKTIPVEYQTKKEIHCDHCGHKRFRNHSMLMRNVKSGEYKEVGSTCVKDFFGHDPRGFMLYARFSIDFPSIKEVQDGEDYGYSGQGYRMGCDNLTEVLAMTSAVIAVKGWKSATSAYEYGGTSTKSMVSEQLNPPKNWKEDKFFVKIYPGETDTEKATATIEYFKALTAEEIGDNDYLMNCHKVSNHNMLPWKLFGVGCSMINAYERYLYGEAEKAKKADEPESNFVGELKERLKLIPVTCIFTKVIYSDYGYDPSTLYIWKDDQGNKFKTFYSGSTWGMEVNDSCLLTGTVKKHDDYKGEKSTMLSRCIVSEIKDENGETYRTFDQWENELDDKGNRTGKVRADFEKIAA
jgi:DNA-directed RNA polymerase subunit RPC12/RpoP